MLSLEKVGKFLKAGRLSSLPFSLFPAAVGYLLAEKNENSLPVLLFVSSAVAVLHVAANLLNTYYDFQYKIDDAEHCHDDTLVKKSLDEDEVLNAAWICLAFSMMFFGSGVVVIRSAHLIPYVLFFKAVFLGFNYSTGLRFKHNCLGEFIVYVTFGPSIAIFVYSCLSKGLWSWSVLLASSPLGIVVASVLFAANIRGAGHHLKCGVRTIANQLGIKNSLNLYSLLLLMPYVQVTGYAILYQHSALFLIWALTPATLYFVFYPHRSSTADSISGLYDRTVVNCHLFASYYLCLLYYVVA